MTKRQLFTNYNRARGQDAIDQVRLNRALGVSQRHNTSGILQNYETTAEKCGCPDWFYRMQHVEGGRCKHQYALALMAG